MHYKKALFIYNPNAGNKKIPKILDEIVKKFIKSKILIMPIRLEKNLYGKIPSILKSYDYDFLIGAGGDGTIMMIAQAIVDTGIDKPFGVIGAGTCNNFAANIGMPIDIMDCVDTISKGESDYVDYGLLNDKEVFLSSVAAGVFAQISFETDQNIKEHLGPMAYYLRGLTQLSTIKANEFTIKTSTNTITKSAYLVILLTGSNVGNFRGLMEDEIKIKDGKFELLVVNESNPLNIGELLIKVVREEDISDSPLIDILQSDYFEISCDNKDIAVSLDGEKGPDLPLKIQTKQKGLHVIVGKTIK